MLMLRVIAKTDENVHRLFTRKKEIITDLCFAHKMS